ncbi:hypothetical protein Tco_1026805 [Tanacetum coccineum]
MFGNMRRVGKGFSGRITPLFPIMVVQNQKELGEGSAIPIDPHHRPTITPPSTSQPQKTQKPRKPKRKDTHVPQPSGPTNIVADEVVHKELGDSLVRVTTTVSSLKAGRDWTVGLKRRVKKLEQKKRSRTHGLKKLRRVGATAMIDSSEEEEEVLGEDASKQGRINAIDADDEITLVNVQEDADAEMFDVGTLTGDEVFVEQEVAAKGVNLTVDEVTLAQALAALKSVKPKVKGDVIKEPSVPVSVVSASIKVSTATTTTATIPTPRKEIVITELEPKHVKLTKKKVQIMLDEEIALKLQAEIDEEERITRAEEEKIDKPILLGMTFKQKLMLITSCLKDCKLKNKSSLQLKKKPHCWKHKDLKSKDFNSIKELFDKAFKRVNMFVDFRTDLVEDSSKRAGTELEQEVTKKQKVDDVQETAEVDDDQEAAKIKELMEIVPDEEEVAIDAIPLAIKSPSIVDWKIHTEGNKSYYQIIRADGKS